MLRPAAITRRGFLRQAAAASTAIAVPTIVPATVLGKDGATAPSERITVGMIGLGRQSIARKPARLPAKR